MENKLFKKIVPAGVGVLIKNEKNEFLLGKRTVKNGKNLWATPGEPNETLEEAGVREVLEETGYKIDKVKFLGITMIVGKKESFFDACLIAEVNSKNFKPICNIKDIECKEWIWVPKKEIKKLNLWKPAEAIFELYWKKKVFYEKKIIDF